MKYTFALLFILFTSSISAQIIMTDDEHQYFRDRIDENEKEFRNINSLIRFVKREESEPKRQVALVYHWMAQNIKYDVKSYTSKRYQSSNPEITFKRRKGVCSGYAELFAYVCNRLEIETKVVSGIAKGYGYSKNKRRIDRSNHAWNAVKIDGEWQLLDVTWGAGGVYTTQSGRLKFRQRTNNDYLFSNPEGFIIKHYPMDAQWQLLDKPITLDQYYSDSLNVLYSDTYKYLKPKLIIN